MEAHTHTHTCDQTHTSPTTNHLTPYPTQQPKNNNHNNSCGIATLFVCYVGRSTWHGRLAAQFCLWSCVTAVCSHLSCVGVRVGCNYAKSSRHATVLRFCVGCPRAPFAFMRCCGSCACVHWVCHLGSVMLKHDAPQMAHPMYASATATTTHKCKWCARTTNAKAQDGCMP